MGQGHADKADHAAQNQEDQDINDYAHRAGQADGDAAQEHSAEQRGHDVHLHIVAQTEHPQGVAAVFRQCAFADLSLCFRNVEGVGTDFAGDDQQHGNGCGDQRPVCDQGAVGCLIGGDGAQGEGAAQAGVCASHTADRQQHQHEGQLIGDHSDHLTAQTHACVGGASGGGADDEGDTCDGQQVQDNDQVRTCREGGTIGAHRNEQGNDDQAGQSQVGGTDEDRLLGATGDDGLLCTALDEVIPRLEDGRANTALHTRNQLPVDTSHQNAEYHTEQQTGENQKLNQIDQKCHDSPPLQKRDAEDQDKGDRHHAVQSVVVDDTAVPVMHIAEVLFQVMLDLGVLLSSKIEKSTIGGKTVFNVEDSYLIACFDDNVTDEVITAIAKQKPYYFVMRDSSMANDSVATNFEQIFAAYSPDTVRKVL